MLKREMPPVHPGRILKNLYMEPLELSQGDAADNLGIARKTLSLLLNEHQGISAEMALRLSKAFDTTPELWMNMQRDYDLWNAGQKVALTKIKHFRRVETQKAEAVAVPKKTTRTPISAR